MHKLFLIGIKDLKLMFRDRAALTFMLLAPFLLTQRLTQVLRNNAPRIETYRLEASGDGLEFSPAKGPAATSPPGWR